MTKDIVERLFDAIQDPHSLFQPGASILPVGELLQDAKREIERLRLAKLPEWARGSWGPVTIVGNTPTTGGKLTAADYDNWLKTIPEPIEPG